MTTPAPCAAILRRLSEYIDQELDPETCGAIEEHCARCAACSRLVESLRRTIGLCRATAERPLPDSVREKARASIEQLLSRRR
jgi:anti-sigma factor RsiW